MKECKLGIYCGRLVRIYPGEFCPGLLLIGETVPGVYEKNGELKPQYWGIQRLCEAKSEIEKEEIMLSEPVEEEEPKLDFRRSLGQLVNYYSREIRSDTPDFILAEYLVECLKAFDRAVRKREWYSSEEVWKRSTIKENRKNG